MMESKMEPETVDVVDAYFIVAERMLKTDEGIRVLSDREVEQEENDQDGDKQPATPGAIAPLLNALVEYYNFQPSILGTTRDAELCVDGKPAGTLLEPSIDTLLEHAQPAPFGQGDQTVYDESVRRAKSIPGEQLTSKSSLTEAVTMLASGLEPAKEVKVQLSKLHIYEEGGHFAPHRDTLRSHDHAGSVVVLLGSAFTGGEFFINGEMCPLEVDQNSKALPLVAFHTDVVHEVRPVTSGVRVSLQFDVFSLPHRPLYDEYDPQFTLDESFREEPSRVPTVDERRCDAVVEQVKARLCKIKYLIIPTYHRYTQRALHTNSLKPLDACLTRKLTEQSCAVTPVPLNVVGNSDACGASFFWQDPYRDGKSLDAPAGTELMLLPSMHGRELFAQGGAEYTGNEAQEAVYAYYFAGLFIEQFQEGAGEHDTEPAAKRVRNDEEPSVTHAPPTKASTEEA